MAMFTKESDILGEIWARFRSCGISDERNRSPAIKQSILTSGQLVDDIFFESRHEEDTKKGDSI